MDVVRGGLGCSRSVFVVGCGLLSGVVVLLLSRERIRPIERNPVSRLLRWIYGGRLRFALRYKLLVLSIPGLVIVLGAGAWFGLARVLSPVEQLAGMLGADLRSLPGYQRACEVLPGLESDDWIALDVPGGQFQSGDGGFADSGFADSGDSGGGECAGEDWSSAVCTGSGSGIDD
jgi:Cu(I)/Ag(I) efflux system membrane protein CusA/SilA